MTRPSGIARRRQLLEEAIREFGRKGYEGTSLDAVAGATGVRKQTLLYYFPTKETLFEACVIEVSERVAAALSEALVREQSSGGKAEAVIRSLFALAETWPEFPNFVREASRMGPDVIGAFARTLEPLRLRAIGFLENGMAEGQIRRQDPALLLFTLYTAVVGSITEAGVLRAVVGEGRAADALRRREREVIGFVRSAMAPSAEPPARLGAAPRRGARTYE